MLEDKRLKLEFIGMEHHMLMHEKHLSTILSNLLSNAIRYSPSESVISILQDDESFRIENHFDYDIDNLNSLSKPFVRGINDQDGHGLGLYVVSNTLQKYQFEYNYFVEDERFIFEFKLASK